MVGYPCTWNFVARSVWTVASTLPNFISDSCSFSLPAAEAYSGARALQWPHHGASARVERQEKSKTNRNISKSCKTQHETYKIQPVCTGVLLKRRRSCPSSRPKHSLLRRFLPHRGPFQRRQPLTDSIFSFS